MFSIPYHFRKQQQTTCMAGGYTQEMPVQFWVVFFQVKGRPWWKWPQKSPHDWQKNPREFGARMAAMDGQGLVRTASWWPFCTCCGRWGQNIKLIGCDSKQNRFLFRFCCGAPLCSFAILQNHKNQWVYKLPKKPEAVSSLLFYLDVYICRYRWGGVFASSSASPLGHGIRCAAHVWPACAMAAWGFKDDKSRNWVCFVIPIVILYISNL